MRLLIDCGNSRIKWATATHDGLSSIGSAAHTKRMDDAVAAMLAAVSGRPERVVVSNVAGPVAGERIAAGIGGALGLAAEFVATPATGLGIRCAYPDPARLGVDRWLAMAAARRSAAGAVCVVSAGTAVTIDVVDSDGGHLGGLILVGARLAADALDRHTAGIGATRVADTPPTGLALLGQTTEHAVGHGSLLAIAAAVDRAHDVVSAALREPLYVLLTGGDAQRIRPWLASQAEVRADLVLEGLLMFVEEDR